MDGLNRLPGSMFRLFRMRSGEAEELVAFG